MENLVNLFTKMVTPDLIQKASGLVGENSDKTGKAFAALGPSVLAGLVSKGSNNAGAEQIINALKGAGGLDDLVNDPIGSLGGGTNAEGVMKTGDSLVNDLLGNKADGIIGMIVNMLGIKGDAAKLLISLVTALLGGQLSKIIGGQGMNPAGLVGLLAGQKDFIKAAAPAGLGNIFDDLNLDGAMSKATNAASNAAEAGTNSLMRYAPLLAVLALGALAFLLLRPGGSAPAPTATVVSTVAAAPVAGTPNPTAVALFCTSINTIGTALDAVGTVSANTPVTALKTVVLTAKPVIDGFKGMIGINTDALMRGFTALETAVNGLTGTTVGDKAKAISDAITGYTAGADAVKKQAGCK